ncbi:MAG: glycerol kinase GlpK [Anaerolineales bacterium]|nr:glycerol kinase GlpK [Anaerolineales bacterium]
MGFVAAIDQGTTSTRCMLFDQQGRVAGSAQKEHQQIYPQPGWVEHEVLEICQRVQEVTSTAIAQVEAQPGDIAAVGITNQRETTVVWNKHSGQPYNNAIVWQDTRTAELCKRLAADGGQDRFRACSGLPLATYFSGPKIMWLLENVPGLRTDAEQGEALFGNIDTWLIWNLTGSHVTDVTNASRTLLLDLETLDWNAETLRALNIPRQMLPRVVPSSDQSTWGNTDSAGALGASIPVCGDLGDQQAALVGQACFDVGDAKNTYGTGCFMLLNTGDVALPSVSGLLTTVAYKLGDQPAAYALEGSIAITGALVQWLRDNLGLINDAAEVEKLADTVDDNGGIYFVPAFSGLFAPYWRSDARGAIVGLTGYINRGHLARATLEATAYQTREVLDAMRKDSGVELTALRVDGGMVHNHMLMQFQSDILGLPVVCPQVDETTALGAAYAAGLAVSFWDNLDDLRANWQVRHTWKPTMTTEECENLYRGWLKAVERTFDWVE